MVTKNLFLFVAIGFYVFSSWAQEGKPTASETDTLRTALKEEGFVVVDTLIAEKRKINPLAPSKAAFLSATIPGLGQIYNKKYWKVPIVWGAIGVGTYAYINFDNRYKAYRSAFKNRKVGLPFEESPFVRISESITDQQLERLQNDRQNDRDLTLLVTILLYALNIVDANVDAHLKQFNVDEKLSMDMQIQPYLDVNPINTNPHYGLALTVKF